MSSAEDGSSGKLSVWRDNGFLVADIPSLERIHINYPTVTPAQTIQTQKKLISTKR